MKIKIEPQQLEEIQRLPTFEAKCEYWKETFDCSFFKTLVSSKEEGFRLIDEANTDNEAQTLVRYEMERVIELHPNILMTKTRNQMFTDLDRTKTFDLLKKQFIEELERLPNSWDKYEQYGFVSNKGLTDVDDIARAFRVVHDFKFIEPTILKSKIQNFIKGFKIAELLEDIKAYNKSEEGPTNDNRIEVNIPAERFAALLYILSTKGVFDLAYFDFNTNYYNGEETAKLCQKHFKIISQKGRTKGQEVSIETLKKVFKESVIKATLETGIDNLFEALVNLPKLTKKG